MPGGGASRTPSATPSSSSVSRTPVLEGQGTRTGGGPVVLDLLCGVDLVPHRRGDQQILAGPSLVPLQVHPLVRRRPCVPAPNPLALTDFRDLRTAAAPGKNRRHPHRRSCPGSVERSRPQPASGQNCESPPTRTDRNSCTTNAQLTRHLPVRVGTDRDSASLTGGQGVGSSNLPSPTAHHASAHPPLSYNPK